MSIGNLFSPVGDNVTVTAGTASDTITFNSTLAADVTNNVVRIAVVGDEGDAIAWKANAAATASNGVVMVANQNPQLFDRGAGVTTLGVITLVGSPVVYAQLGKGTSQG